MNLDNLTKAQLIERLKQHETSESGKTISDLQNKLAETEEQRATALEKLANAPSAEEVSGYKEIISELTEHNRALEQTKGNRLPVIKVKGKRYQFRMATMRTRKGRLTAFDVAKDQELCEELIAVNSPGLQEVVKPSAKAKAKPEQEVAE